jgi:tRNA wybutosine-synthesizing protein 3
VKLLVGRVGAKVGARIANDALDGKRDPCLPHVHVAKSRELEATTSFLINLARLLPAMTNRFQARKQNILAQLETPDSDYHDLSPKGSVDEPIRDLIDEINTIEGLVTTSSCSGRISVFLEGLKPGSEDALVQESRESRAGPGGKGGGGAWLFISHASVEAPSAHMSPNFLAKFGLESDMAHREEEKIPEVNSRYIHLKFEPMVSSILAISNAV